LKRHRAQSKLEFEGHCKHKVSTKSMMGRELNSKTNKKSNGVLREYTNTLDNDEQKKHKTR